MKKAFAKFGIIAALLVSAVSFAQVSYAQEASEADIATQARRRAEIEREECARAKELGMECEIVEAEAPKPAPDNAQKMEDNTADAPDAQLTGGCSLIVVTSHSSSTAVIATLLAFILPLIIRQRKRD